MLPAVQIAPAAVVPALLEEVAPVFPALGHQAAVSGVQQFPAKIPACQFAVWQISCLAPLLDNRAVAGRVSAGGDYRPVVPGTVSSAFEVRKLAAAFWVCPTVLSASCKTVPRTVTGRSYLKNSPWYCLLLSVFWHHAARQEHNNVCVACGPAYCLSCSRGSGEPLNKVPNAHSRRIPWIGRGIIMLRA